MQNRWSGLVTVALLSVSAVQAEDSISFKSTELGPGIFMLEGVGGFAGGNLGLLTGDDGVVLIDDGLEQLAPKLLDAVTEVSGAPVDFVINTHVHGDHVGGNAALHDHGATIVAHDSIRKRMLADDAAREALPEITFADGVTFHLNEHRAQVFHVEAGHTDGDAVIYFADANIIHTGDLMFNGLFPFIDLDSGGTLDGYIAGQRQILGLADGDTQIIPGHGPLANRADLERALAMLIDARDRIRKMRDDGMSASEIKAANPLADYHDDWNWGFITTERMTEQLIRGLGGS